MAANNCVNSRIMQPIKDVQVAFPWDDVGALHAMGYKGVNNDVPGRLLCRRLTIFTHLFGVFLSNKSLGSQIRKKVPQGTRCNVASS